MIVGALANGRKVLIFTILLHTFQGLTLKIAKIALQPNITLKPQMFMERHLYG
jgi:hypothetical protein